jgi:O-antigen/teichoic acid export membrane protein
MKREMLANNIASAGSIFWRTIAQLLAPATLIAWWGPTRYGEWIFIASLPSFLAVADLGFADAAASRMTMEIAKGHKSEATRIFQTIFAMTLVLCVGLMAVGLPFLFFEHLEIGLVRLDHEMLATAFLLVACYSPLLLLSSLFLGCLRAGRHYAESTLIYDAIQFFETIAVLWAAYAGKTFFVCALVISLIRAINVIMLAGWILRRMSWLRWGFRLFDLNTLRILLGPALAAMAVPVALAFNFQGTIWIAGSTIGPAAAAVLSTVRTASRVIIQMVGIFSRAAMPIYSASVAVNNERSREIIERILRLLLLFLLAPGCVLFGAFGRQLVGIWTHGNVDPPSVFIWLIAIGTFFHGCWSFGTNLLVSINRHVKFGVALVIITCVFTPLGLPSAKFFGLNGIAANLMVLELLTLIAFSFLSSQSSSVRYQLWSLVR